jgi:hypothetical protein
MFGSTDRSSASMTAAKNGKTVVLADFPKR